ncbi:hypothetical protein BP5796_03277 [Coleophoma crateriformis]|uniref:Uncharacterized protein n=1 Tax=Coleophoma crateriformis TaxID=565419 RepID=A0A3D8SMN0_9HELO|nr:hypothetical protein BP5796_03277 [Coleophoma crateriformis]
MRISLSLLIPALVGAASAASESASVYIFEGQQWPSTSKPATLTPEEARLVIAQRLDVAEYHGLERTSEETLSYINNYGGSKKSLFESSLAEPASELVIVVEGVSSEIAKPLLSSWQNINPAFYISSPPSVKANQRLVADLNQQRGGKRGSWDMKCDLEDAINPYNENCWAGRTKMMHVDLSPDVKVSKVVRNDVDDGPNVYEQNHISIDDFMTAQTKLQNFAKNGEMNVVIILSPEASRSAKASTKSYGSYEMPMSDSVNLNRRQAEELITTEAFASTPAAAVAPVSQVSAPNTTFAPLKGVIAFCHDSLDACISATNNCSGHGSCYGRSNSTAGVSSCYTCRCLPTVKKFEKGGTERTKTTHWGGAACNKEDISGQFWLLAGFTVILVGIVSSAIGMMFSIGEEKLPGVIGAGVSSKTR